jgi:anti-sigma regulatory factor (Ser/Thr protein kinase)
MRSFFDGLNNPGRGHDRPRQRPVSSIWRHLAADPGRLLDTVPFARRPARHVAAQRSHAGCGLLLGCALAGRLDPVNGQVDTTQTAAGAVGADPAPARLAFSDSTNWIALAAEPRAVQAARSFTISMLGAWDVDDATAGNAVLVVSELLTNAIQATPDQGRVWLRLGRRPGHVTVEVADGSPGFPTPAARLGGDEEHGRGLLIVGAICEEWGCYQLPGTGKVVEAMLRTQAAGA